MKDVTFGAINLRYKQYSCLDKLSYDPAYLLSLIFYLIEKLQGSLKLIPREKQP